MTAADLDHWLGEWGHWQAMGNRAHGLGIKAPAYAERIGGGSYGSQAPDVAEVEVLRLDDVIKSLAPAIREPIDTHYCDPRPVKSKSSPGYYAKLGVAKEALLFEINKTRARNSAAI